MKRFTAMLLTLALLLSLLPTTVPAVLAQETQTEATAPAETTVPEATEASPETEAPAQTTAPTEAEETVTPTEELPEPTQAVRSETLQAIRSMARPHEKYGGGSMFRLDPSMLPATYSAQAQSEEFIYLTQALDVIQQEMIARNTEFTINTYVEYDSTVTEEDMGNLFGSLVALACVHTGQPDAGDYLSWHISYADGEGAYYDDGTYFYMSFTYQVEYLTTAGQEADMDAAVSILLTQLVLGDKTDYQKVKAIYDYITANITYDYAGLADQTDRLEHSAYAALIKKTAVCQGYATLFYRLALEAGIDNRVIGGTGNGEAHGWNIVKLEDLYYNVDATWDAGQSEYQYFLRNEANFTDHSRDEVYASDDFYQAYPMGETDYSPIKTGTCGTNAVWTLDEEGNLTISGTGAVDDSGTWSKAEVKTVTVEAGITEIGQSVFRDCTALTELTLPAGLTAIGADAFYNCTGLEKVDFPASLKQLGDSAFRDCTGLKSVVIPGSLEKCGAEVFAGCTGLTSAQFPAQIDAALAENYLKRGLFSGCTSLTTVNLPQGITQIPARFFNGCTALTEVEIPTSVTAIGSYAFERCTSLEQADLPVGIEMLDYGVFLDCTSLEEAVLPLTLKEVRADAYSGCSSLKSVTMPGGVENYGSNIFAGCTGLTTVEFTGDWSQTELPEGTFNGCTSLTKITLPAGITKIPAMFLRNCTALTEVSIPDTVTVIDTGAFMNCEKLRSVTLPANLTEIADMAFSDCTSMTEIALPQTLEHLGDYAFSGCTALEHFQFPDTLKTLGWGVLGGCTSLTEVTLWKTLLEPTENSGDTFEGCTALETVTIPAGTEQILPQMFYGCTALKTVNLPDSITVIGADAFRGCTALTKIELPKSVKSIGNGTFEDCTALAEVTFSEGLETIDERAFMRCSALTELTIPSTVTALNAYAFGACGSLKVTFLGDAPTMNARQAFDASTVTLHYPAGAAGWDAVIDAYNAGTGTAKVTFVADISLTAPVVSARNHTSGKPSMKWEQVDGAAKYEIHRAVSGTDAFARIYTTAYLSFTNSGAEDGVSYDYKVRAVAADGTVGPFSNVLTFSGEKPTMEITAKNHASGKPSMQWKKLPEASKYEIYRAVSGTDNFTRIFTTSYLSFTNTGAEVGVSYDYKVRAVLTEGGYSHFSNVLTLEAVEIAVETPAITVREHITGKPSFTWEKLLSASKYEIHRAPSGTDAFTRIFTTGHLSFTNTSAEVGVSYDYKIRAVLTAGGYSDFSNVLTLQAVEIIPEPPVLAAKTYDGDKPSMKWNKVLGATKYEVHRAAAGTGEFVRVYTTVYLSFTNTSAPGGVALEYKVRAVMADGSLGEFSNVLTFEAGDFIITAKEQASGKPSMKWSKVPSAVKYEIHRAVGLEDFERIYTTTYVSYTNTGAPGGVVVYYKIRPVFADGSTGEFSNVLAFEVPLTLTVRTHSSGKPSMKWDTVPGAVRYEVHRAVAGTGEFARILTTRNLSLTNTGAASGETYDYKVRPVFEDGSTGEFSNVITITSA